MKVNVTDLETGDILLSDAFNRYGLLIFSTGARIDNEAITLLLQHQVEYVDIMSRASSLHYNLTALDRPYSHWKASYEDALKNVQALFEMAELTGLIDSNLVEASFHTLAESFQGKYDISSMLLVLNEKDDYTYRHSVQVGMISFYLAKWLGKSDAECRSIGVAGYLHDIGKMKIPDEILIKPEPLTPEEFDIVKMHAEHGFTMIAESIGNTEWALAALQHHERFDGSGYPHGIKGSDISPVAKIVAIADIYSAMITQAPYRKPKDLLYVLNELHHMSFGQIDPYITQVFIRNMLPSMIGKDVLLNNGEQGKIIMMSPSDIFNPLIQVSDQFIDLATTPEFYIVEFMNHDASQF